MKPPALTHCAVSVSAQLVVQLVAIVLVAPAMLLPGVVILALGAWVGNVYMKAQLPVKRDMSNKKAPVLGHFSASIAGLGTAVTSLACRQSG